MLIPGKIPIVEPTIRVGLILPEDSRQKLIVRLDPPDNFTSDPATNESLPPELHLQLSDGSIIVQELSSSPFKTFSISYKNRQQPDSSICIASIPVGRGFHWQKIIEVAYYGQIHVKVDQGRLIVINELPLETYLQCVATSEMSASCPSTLLEVQTVVARSWVLANREQKHAHWGMDVCNDDCCQRYQGLNFLTPQAMEANRNTRGQVLIHNDQIVDARYSKSCGGMTERFENVWAGPPQPYLQNVPDMPKDEQQSFLSLANETNFRKWILTPPNAFCSPRYVPENSLSSYLGKVDRQETYFRWEIRFSSQELSELVNKKTGLKTEKIIDLVPLKRGGSGRIKKLKIEYSNPGGKPEATVINSEYEIRRILHPKFLFSSAFLVEKSGNTFQLKGSGWGHGVGLCQIGALGMALKEYSTSDILRHYYLGTELRNIYK